MSGTAQRAEPRAALVSLAMLSRQSILLVITVTICVVVGAELAAE
jgi:hypothetical protein